MEMRWESRKCDSRIDKHGLVFIYKDLQYVYGDYLLHCKILNSKERFHQCDVLKKCLLIAHFSVHCLKYF